MKKYEKAKTGLSISIRKKRKGSIKIWEAINGRILKLDMNIWGYKLIIIGIYASNEDNGVRKKRGIFC